MWTLGPIVLYMLAVVCATTMAVVRASKHDSEEIDVRSAMRKAFTSTNHLALGLVSLVHTLICVRIFQIFDCINFDVGVDEHQFVVQGGIVRILSSDLSLDCESSKHESFEVYAYFMVAVYVVIVPAAMALDKRRLLSASHRGLLAAPYKKAYWWFDAADLYYRLTMTGLLLLISPSTRMRIIYCIYISISFLAYIVCSKPFLNDSLNNILITGQFVVCVTVASGFIVGELDDDNSNRVAIGWLLLIVNLVIIASMIHQHWREPLFHAINAIEEMKDFDAALFSKLYAGASKIPLTNVLLKVSKQSLERLSNGDEECWIYMTKMLFPLRGSNGQFVFNESIPLQVGWMPLAESIIENRMKEKIRHTIIQELRVIQEGWCTKQGKLNRAWGRCYLLLTRMQDRETLMYFDSQEAAAQMRATGVEERALGSITLAGIREVRPVEAHKSIELDDLSGNIWKFRFDSREDHHRWMGALDTGAQDIEAGRGRSSMEMDAVEFHRLSREVLGLLVDYEVTNEVFMKQAIAHSSDFEATNPLFKERLRGTPFDPAFGAPHLPIVDSDASPVVEVPPADIDGVAGVEPPHREAYKGDDEEGDEPVAEAGESSEDKHRTFVESEHIKDGLLLAVLEKV